VVKPISSQTHHAYTLLQDGVLSHHIPMPIIIDKTSSVRDGEEEEKESTFDFECATILYNYGLLYSISSTIATTTSRSSEINAMTARQSALRIQELASTVLSRIDERYHSQQQQSSCYPMQERVLLGLLLTHGLIDSYKAMNRTPPKEYYMALSQLKDYLQQQHQFYPAAHELRIAPVA
jgi:hypothetical protein